MTQLDHNAPMTDRPAKSVGPTTVLFEIAFRPFFLLAPLYAVICVSTLIGALYFGAWPERGLSPALWHGHEMIYGFVAAAIAGFLLTAVPNWTGTRGVSPPYLVALVLLWLGGRLAFSPFVSLERGTAAGIDLAFVPALAAVLAPPLIRAKSYRNLGFLILLGLLAVGNVFFHAGQQEWFDARSIDGLRLAVNTVLLVVVVVGGRIVPTFTRNALVRRGISHTIVPHPTIDAFAIVAVLLVLVVDVVAPGSASAIVASGAAALIHLIRLLRWQGWKALAEPIVWVLHVGYAWLVLALALKAVWLWLGVPVAAHWIHALTAGAFGTLILGVMSRVALGHTGRPLVVPRSIATAYVMVSLGTLLRVFVAALLPAHYITCVAIGGFLWVAAFVVFVAVYAPILTRPRVVST